MAHDSPLLTVIIPAYNEAHTICESIGRVRASISVPHEIVVVDDASIDATADVVQPLVDDVVIRYLRHEENRGKGSAIRTGLEVARGKYTVIQDADLEYDPNDIRRLFDKLCEGNCDVVYGSRYLQKGHTTRLFDYGVRFLNMCVFVLFGLRTTDEATCYKMASTDVFRTMKLKCERFEFCPEFTAKVARLRLRFGEVPISYTPRSILDGKKLRLSDGVVALYTLLKWRIMPVR